MWKALFIASLFFGTSAFSQNKPDPYKDCRIGNTKIDNQIYESEFEGQTRLRMVNRRNKEIKGYQFLGGELRVKGGNETGEIYKGGELSPEALTLLANSGGKLIYMTIVFIDLLGEKQTRKSLFAVIDDSPKAETE
mgnify:CR=1 FL=1